MGRLTFGEGLRVDAEDRSIAHVHRVMLAKLRRGEGLHFSWRDDMSVGDGRTTVWVHPDAPLVCKLTRQIGTFNLRWLDELTIAANSNDGLTFLTEPEEQSAQKGRS
ncbi:hypothetical protein BWL13_01293 [Microbacterium oleivorans]|uniref:DUF7882 family protein n=1 Tax=Microbacterium oleivorans TaxID=273677 RepID=UPI000976D9AF|nr:hypothetical protein [Microbacterium oleivorans]AZS43726.1 hypothetical protein BWL13_01293 [Microbacterium oleivorans]